jgi:hypothetical protein
MTVTEFNGQQATLICSFCGHNTLTTERNPNNNALQVICSTCQSRRPIRGSITNLKQTTKKRRGEYPDGESLEEVWARYNDCCVVCGAPKDFLLRMRIGRQRHHVMSPLM